MKTHSHIHAVPAAFPTGRSFIRSLRTTPRELTRSVGCASAALLSTVGLASAQVGTNYCTPAALNSTGQPAHISAIGSSNLSVNNYQLTLRADHLPQDRFGFFITSRTRAFVAQPGGSQGNLCLGGTVGRYIGPGQVLNSGATGSFDLLVDLSMTPEGGAFVQVVGGETWHYQAWYRDSGPAGQPWSNLSNALEVQFTGGGTPIMGMTRIPPGTFMMGSSALGLPPFFAPVGPVHEVTISYSFWMGRHEVTQAEYQALMGANPSFFSGASLPVESVSWHEARAYCTALTALEAGNLPPGYEYRLPTEAEWEYTCRAGTTTEFFYGQDLFCNQARFSQSYHSGLPADCDNPTGTAPVGSYAPNAFGLYDMHGNVWEYCLDSWAPYSPGPVTDPFVATSIPARVMRGGAWRGSSIFCRSALRSSLDPSDSAYVVGFRLVLAPVLVP